MGKSTFCERLLGCLNCRTNLPATVMRGLGMELKKRGIPYGSAATPDGIAAAYSIHIRRELDAPTGIVILDRCIVDALAYVRSLALTSPLQTALYEDVSFARAQSLRLVIHLEMTGRFLTTTATHEAAELRTQVAREIPPILVQLNLRHLSLNAAEDNAVERAASAILALLSD